MRIRQRSGQRSMTSRRVSWSCAMMRPSSGGRTGFGGSPGRWSSGRWTVSSVETQNVLADITRRFHEPGSEFGLLLQGIQGLHEFHANDLANVPALVVQAIDPG